MRHDLVEQIIEATAIVYGVSRAELLAGGYHSCAPARNAAMSIIMRMLPTMHYTTLGLMMDGRHADTVERNIKTHRRLMSRGCPTTIANDRKIRELIGRPERTASDVIRAMGL